MNQKRRQALNNLVGEIDALSNRLMEVHDEEQDAFVNLPDAIQNAAKGEAMETAIERLLEAAGLLNDASETILEARATPI